MRHFPLGLRPHLSRSKRIRGALRVKRALNKAIPHRIEGRQAQPCVVAGQGVLAWLLYYAEAFAWLDLSPANAGFER